MKNGVKILAIFQGIVYNIKAVCRDGGAAERARFEIVLCRNVYKGSNPFLCAKSNSFELFRFKRVFFYIFKGFGVFNIF